MSKIEIRITDLETGEPETLHGEGYLLFLIENDKIRSSGKIDIKALAPILTRIALEKLSK